MPDKEKVIKGLETCIPMKYETNEEKECRHEQCPYGRENYKPMNGCFWDLMSDALVLLKEQEPVPVIKREFARMFFWCCGSCGVAITEGDKFCRNCGKQVKWE